MLADDRLPTFAVARDDFLTQREAGLFEICEGAEEATAQLEAWRYDPAILGTAGSVDPISLYLSLRKSADERVQQALGQLVADVKW